MTDPNVCCSWQVVIPYVATYSLSLCHAECVLHDTCNVGQCNVLSCALDCLQSTPLALYGLQYLKVLSDLVWTACFCTYVF